MRTRLKFALALVLWVMPTPVSIEVKSVTVIFTAPLSLAQATVKVREISPERWPEHGTTLPTMEICDK